MLCKYRAARLGLLLCPTTAFAALLCELGQKRARENSVAEKSPVYWRRIIPLGQTSSIAFPFSCLDREPFWEMVPQSGTTITPAIINNASSVTYPRNFCL